MTTGTVSERFPNASRTWGGHRSRGVPTPLKHRLGPPGGAWQRVTREPQSSARLRFFFWTCYCRAAARAAARKAAFPSWMATQPVPPKAASGAIVIGMAQTNPYRRRSKISVPPVAHPLSKCVFALMREHGVTYDELEWKSGVLRSTFKAWRTNNKPGLDTIEAALGVFSYSVLPVPPADALPAELRADLEAVAAKHGTKTLPVLQFISAAVGRRPTDTIDARTRLKGPGQCLARAA